MIAATGASQFEFLAALTATPGVDWGRVDMFHLDEYVGLPDSHPASFRRYLRERIVERVRPRTFHFLAGDAADPAAECRRVGALLARPPVDVAFVGIGENGHLAFNDPPADFETEEPYLWSSSTSRAAAAARRGLVREARRRAAPRHLDVDPPDPEGARDALHRARRAEGEGRRECLEGGVSPLHPSSILQTHRRRRSTSTATRPPC